MLITACTPAPTATPAAPTQTRALQPSRTAASTQTQTATVTQTPTSTLTPTKTPLPTAPADELPVFILNYWTKPWPQVCDFETYSRLLLLKPPYDHFEDFVSFEDANVFYPSLSHNGEWLAYVYSAPEYFGEGIYIPENSGNTSIWLASLDGEINYQLSPALSNYCFDFNNELGAHIYASPVWSPDDKFISIKYWGTSNNLYLVEVETGKLIDIPIGTFDSPFWLNNSQFLVTSINSVFIVSLMQNDGEWDVLVEPNEFFPESEHDSIVPLFLSDAGNFIFVSYEYVSYEETIYNGFWELNVETQEWSKLDDVSLPEARFPAVGNKVTVYGIDEEHKIEFYSKDTLALVGEAILPEEQDEISWDSFVFGDNYFAWIDSFEEDIYLTEIYGARKNELIILNVEDIMPDRIENMIGHQGYLIGIEAVPPEAFEGSQSFPVVPTPTEVPIQDIEIGQTKYIPGRFQVTLKDVYFSAEITAPNPAPDGFWQSYSADEDGRTLIDVLLNLKEIQDTGLNAIDVTYVIIGLADQELHCDVVFEDQAGQFLSIWDAQYVNLQQGAKVHHICEVPEGLEKGEIPFWVRIVVDDSLYMIEFP